MLGDIAAFVFQPVARGVDAVLGTNLKGCSSCKGRQEWLNQVTDDIFALFSRRARDNDTSPMDYTVVKQFSAQILILGARDTEDALERAQKGEGERTQSGQSWQAIAMKPQQPQEQGVPGGPVGAVGGPRKP